MKKGLEFKPMDGKKLKIGIARSRWNNFITDSLVKNCREALSNCGVSDKNIYEIEVPGTYEIPLAAKKLIEGRKVDAVICLGSLIKGETMHFEYIAEAVTNGVMKLNLDTGVPVVFGVLTCLTKKMMKQVNEPRQN